MTRQLHLLYTLWRCKWGLARLALAGGLLWVLVADNPARLARVQFASLPGVDYLTEVRTLRHQKRFAEALMVAEAGLPELKGADREALLKEQKETREEQESVLRK